MDKLSLEISKAELAGMERKDIEIAELRSQLASSDQALIESSANDMESMRPRSQKGRREMSERPIMLSDANLACVLVLAALVITFSVLCDYISASIAAVGAFINLWAWLRRDK